MTKIWVSVSSIKICINKEYIVCSNVYDLFKTVNYYVKLQCVPTSQLDCI